jgi:hypothetical protein
MAASIDIRVVGANELAELAAKLKRAGNNELRKELLRGIRTAARPMVTREAARRELPRRGGLAERIAKSKITTRTRTSRTRPGVRVVGMSGYDLDAIDKGVVRHPTYGHGPWVAQRVKAGWFTDTLEHESKHVRKELRQAIDRIDRQL